MLEDIDLSQWYSDLKATWRGMFFSLQFSLIYIMEHKRASRGRVQAALLLPPTFLNVQIMRSRHTRRSQSAWKNGTARFVKGLILYWLDFGRFLVIMSYQGLLSVWSEVCLMVGAGITQRRTEWIILYNQCREARRFFLSSTVPCYVGFGTAAHT